MESTYPDMEATFPNMESFFLSPMFKIPAHREAFLGNQADRLADNPGRCVQKIRPPNTNGTVPRKPCSSGWCKTIGRISYLKSKPVAGNYRPL